MVMKKKTLIGIAAVCLIVAGLAAISLAVYKKNEKFTYSNTSFSMHEYKKKKIMSLCPYSLDGDCQWTFYPADNVLGLVAIAKVRGQSNDKDVYVFESQKDNVLVIKALKNDAPSGLFTDEFNFDRFGTASGFDQKDYFYLMLEYDSIFGEGYTYSCEYNEFDNYSGIEIRINMKDELGLEKGLIYSENLSRCKSIYSQSFDAESGSWNEVSVEETHDSSGLGSTMSAGYLRVSQSTEGFRDDPEERLRIINYGYDRISTDGDIFTVRLDIGFYGENSHIEQNSEIKLYYWSGDEYVDVTPEDIRLEDLEYDSDNQHVQRGVITFTYKYKGFDEFEFRDGIEDGHYRLDIGSHETYFFKEFVEW